MAIVRSNRVWTAVILGGMLILLAAMSAPAQTFSVLHSFSGPDGENLNSGLLQTSSGVLYGATIYGGPNGDGTIFSITPGGVFETIGDFDGTNGANPFSTPIEGTDGNIYGTTNRGGAFDLGLVYQLGPSASPQALYSLQSRSGSPAQGGIVQGSDGNFYGITLFGGAYDWGTVFRVSPAGTFTLLHNFARNDSEGGNPYPALVQANDGNFYGTTYDGGPSDEGTIFRITPGGGFTTIYDFCLSDGCPDGARLVGGLVQGSDGNLYGLAAQGGSSACIVEGNTCGTVFKITLDGELTTLHQFTGPDGATPVDALVQGPDGNFYGTTAWYGANSNYCAKGCGTIFSITPGGSLTTLHNFCTVAGCPDGASPAGGGLIEDTNGRFYGTTSYGGTSNDGTVFSLDVGLGAFVKTNPLAGVTGQQVRILGTNLTGATSVTFNGVAATFSVASGSEILATVPAGAATGPVQVVMPTGTLTSNPVFQVLP
jgi:uncharacterized repeat protein (TIGR03803 family)